MKTESVEENGGTQLVPLSQWLGVTTGSTHALKSSDLQHGVSAVNARWLSSGPCSQVGCEKQMSGNSREIGVNPLEHPCLLDYEAGSVYKEYLFRTEMYWRLGKEDMGN